MTDAGPNQEQATWWNEEAGHRWVKMNRELDAQLEPFGVAVMDRLGLGAGARVIDVGCGGGATSIMLADKVRPGNVLGVDLSGPMLAHARSRAQGLANVRFEHADAQTFAFEPLAFDVAFSRFGVMFFADPVAAFANLRSALRPGGPLGFVCWRDVRENPSFSVPVEAALPWLPVPPAAPEPGAAGPFALSDRSRIQDILERAGFVEIDIVAHDSELIFAGRADIEAAVDLAMQIGPLSRALGDADDSVRAKVRAAVREAFAPRHGPSGVVFPAATWIVVAR